MKHPRQMATDKMMRSRMMGGACPPGFSLIELLVVLALGGLLTAVAVPAFSSMRRATDVGQSAYQVAELLELARTHAIANNQRVEVGFRADTEGLSAVVIADRSNSTNIVPISKIRRFPAVRLDEVSSAAPVRPEADVQLPGFSGGFSNFSIGGREFEHVIQFNSRGEASVAAQTLNRVIEIDLLPNIAGRTPEAMKANAAVVQVTGLAGGVSVYRP